MIVVNMNGRVGHRLIMRADLARCFKSIVLRPASYQPRGMSGVPSQRDRVGRFADFREDVFLHRLAAIFRRTAFTNEAAERLRAALTSSTLSKIAARAGTLERNCN
jgi:hypothetical protein